MLLWFFGHKNLILPYLLLYLLFLFLKTYFFCYLLTNMAGQYGVKTLCWLLWRKGIYKLVMSHVLKTEIFTLTWVHMVTKPHGANHVKLNLSFMVLDTNRSICICLQSPLICFWSNNTQMGHPIRGAPGLISGTSHIFFTHVSPLITTYADKSLHLVFMLMTR